MGRSQRPRPARLAEKLREIRVKLNLTQQQIFGRLGETKTALYPGHIGLYELGKREPPLPVLLSYARLVGISTDVLIDDELDLPQHLTAMPERERTMKRGRASKRH